MFRDDNIKWTFDKMPHTVKYLSANDKKWIKKFKLNYIFNFPCELKCVWIEMIFILSKIFGNK